MPANSTEIVIRIPGKPKARQAHQMKSGFKFLPKESREFQSTVRMCAAEAMGDRPPIETLVSVEYLFVFPAPMSSLKKGEKQSIANGELLPWHLPQDFDNLCKSVNDGIKTVVIADDKLIADFSGCKRIGRVPMTVVTVRVLPFIRTGMLRPRY